MDGFSSYDPVRIANEEISIYFVAEKAGIDLSYAMGNNSKLYCPFGGITHVDGGATKAFRFYPDTNSAYCFACQEYFTPVKLYVAVTDLTPWEAAEQLLEEAGWKPETYEDKWSKLTEEETYDNSFLLEALDNFCTRLNSDWPVLKFDEPYKSAHAKCVKLARAVTSKTQAVQWFKAVKPYLRGVIDAERQ